MPYVGAFAAGVTSASWQPGTNLHVKGYQSAITQVGVGIGVNWLAEFVPDVKRVLRFKDRRATGAISRDKLGNEFRSKPFIGGLSSDE